MPTGETSPAHGVQSGWLPGWVTPAPSHRWFPCRGHPPPGHPAPALHRPQPKQLLPSHDISTMGSPDGAAHLGHLPPTGPHATRGDRWVLCSRIRPWLWECHNRAGRGWGAAMGTPCQSSPRSAASRMVMPMALVSCCRGRAAAVPPDRGHCPHAVPSGGDVLRPCRQPCATATAAAG